MKRLFEIDLHDYESGFAVSRRPSARGVIIKDGRIALVYSKKERYYKFPGGGIEGGEDIKDALIREIKEEVGLTVIPESIREFGSVMRRQRSNYLKDTIFEQENFYFVCETLDRVGVQELDDYEQDAGFELRFADIDEAIEVNGVYHSEDPFDEIMIKREMRVLEIVKEKLY